MLTSALLGALLLQQPTAPPQAAGDARQQRAEEQHQKAIKDDIELGKKSVIEVEKEIKLSENKEYIERVNRIGQELAAIARTEKVEVWWGDKRLSKFDYTFKVIKDDDVNAFSIPGGFIYVNEGVVKYAESDDEIAAVLAHEISHAEQRHIATLISNSNKISTPALLGLLAAIATGNAEMIRAALFLGSNVVQAFSSKWSVEAEKSADHGGFQYMLKSKYNGTAMLTFMERLALDQHNDVLHNMDWGIYQTHPVGKDRAEAVLADMRRWNVPVQRSLVTTRFRAEVKPGKDGVDIWFNKQRLYTFAGSDAIKRADEAALKLNNLFDQEPSLYEITASDDDVLGRRAVLFSVEAEDAKAANRSREDLAKGAVQTIRASLYNFAFKVWR